MNKSDSCSGDWNHEWIAVYYGHSCERCGLFYPFGCAPWEMIDEELDDVPEDE